MRKKGLVGIIALMLGVVTFALIGCNNKNLSGEDFSEKFYSNWMSYMQEETSLIDLVIPGSHDSGSVGVSFFYETQQSSFADQLKGGVRYFDARVTYDGDTLKYIHGSSDGGGAKGLEFETSLQEMVKFTEENPSEVIILDFQHTWEKAKLDVLEMLEKYIPIDKMASNTEFDGLNDIKLGDMQKANKNFVVVWRSADLSNDTISGKSYIFSRDKYLYSPYNGNIHKKNYEDLIAHYPNYFSDAAKEQNSKKLFVLQGVRTGGGVGGLNILSLEKAFRSPMNKYIRSIKDNTEQLNRVNVIMRDFIVDEIKDTEKCVENINSILILNKYKGLVKADLLEKFDAIIK